ncbi:BOB1 [Symbiodinium microadriaticum]|nr:BOB1 [Symbiodinium microadriaticum]
MRILAVCWLSTWLLKADGTESPRKEGALGPGSEALEREEAERLLQKYKLTFSEDGDPLRRRGQDLACSACQLAAKRFQSKVASRIKGKMPDAEKKTVFQRGLTTACEEAQFPQQLAVVEKEGKQFYVDFQEALGSAHGRVNVKAMSPEIKADVINGCRHLLQKEWKDSLLQKVLSTPKGGRASDVDFGKLICGPKMSAVCDEEEESDGDREEDEPQILLVSAVGAAVQLLVQLVAFPLAFPGHVHPDVLREGLNELMGRKLSSVPWIAFTYWVCNIIFSVSALRLVRRASASTVVLANGAREGNRFSGIIPDWSDKEQEQEEEEEEVQLRGSAAHVLCMFLLDLARAATRGEQRVAMAELSFLRILKFMLGPPGVPIFLVLMFDAILAMIVLTVVLLILPKRVLSKSKLVRTARNKLLRLLSRMVELSMQGPVALLVVWLGRKVFRGRLDSVPKPPHGVSPKAEGTYDVSVQFSPTKGWNPFHQETYVVAFRKEGVNWLERPFKPGENLEDMSGDAKKGNRFKATVDGLPIGTRITFRVCALSYWGRGPWSREASVSTMAKPSKDFGCTGPLGPAREKTGSDKKQYVWLQTRNEVHIRIPVGTDVRGKDVKFKALPLRLQVDLAVGGETLELLHGQLAHRINSDDATWYIDESKEEGRYIQITIFKLEALDRWSRVFEGDEHPEIDVRHVQWFVDPLNPGTLGDLDEWTSGRTPGRLILRGRAGDGVAQMVRGSTWTAIDLLRVTSKIQCNHRAVRCLGGLPLQTVSMPRL